MPNVLQFFTSFHLLFLLPSLSPKKIFPIKSHKENTNEQQQQQQQQSPHK